MRGKGEASVFVARAMADNSPARRSLARITR
jgi:hypothetical protein